MPSLVAACVLSTIQPDRSLGITAIDKRAASGPIQVRRLGLHGDVQVDRKNHGGADKAVYAYGQDDADFWSSELGRPLHPGWFGENLRVEGFDVNGARPGDRWRIGGSVELEVTMPRSPCATFARWVGGADARGWVKRFADEGRLGAYLRVIHTGPVRAGDPIELIWTEPSVPTILEMFRA